ncbi:Transcription factor TFIIE, alpha subunit [Methanocaldococcus infernus ME]|uniref:Transcription factor E n=1 Tax=Methanocaldococcus infernus (strain DSM 11812 / JCM 15783 / ME) TaxID=573063 RepID=D5VQY9_METIM|nr:transcription factor E [Methanocaldococcus infernus]ADG12992.1 Transcription factor TFIIE, alpha subunit [Methanocaldococcus infernus ME]
MKKRFLEDPLVQEFLFNVFEGDETGFELLKVLLDKGEVTEEELAKELGLKLNIIRKLLYKLYDARLVAYRKWKEEDRNWFYYTWKPTIEKLPYVLKKRVLELIKELEERLRYEKENVFFYCERCNIRIPFDKAMDFNFQCPACGSQLKEFDNSEIIKELEEQIKFLKEELKKNPIINSGKVKT